jgi:hypothetical protein
MLGKAKAVKDLRQELGPCLTITQALTLDFHVETLGLILPICMLSPSLAMRANQS